MSKEYTENEVRDKFLDHIWGMIDYWKNESRAPDVEEKLEGLAHSILVALDGCAAILPGFVVAPAPHKSDKLYCIENGEDYYPEAPQVKCDISGGLHEKFYSRKP